jgi:hypothetical protein
LHCSSPRTGSRAAFAGSWDRSPSAADASRSPASAGTAVAAGPGCCGTACQTRACARRHSRPPPPCPLPGTCRQRPRNRDTVAAAAVVVAAAAVAVELSGPGRASTAAAEGLAAAFRGPFGSRRGDWGRSGRRHYRKGPFGAAVAAAGGCCNRQSWLTFARVTLRTSDRSLLVCLSVLAAVETIEMDR